MKRKMFSLFLALTVVISMFSFSAYADAESAWDGTSVDISWYNGNDTAYFISTPAALAGLAQLVNDGTSTFEGKTVVLKSDINLGGKNWTPIGEHVVDAITAKVDNTTVTKIDSITKMFKGTFEGLGHKIVNLTVNDTNSNNRSAAFFTVLGGSVKNVGFENVSVTNKSYGDVGAATLAYAMNSNSRAVNVYVKSANLEITSPTTSSRAGFVGGLASVMFNGAVIENCYCNGVNVKFSANTNSYAGAAIGTGWGTTADGAVSPRYDVNNSGKKFTIKNSYFVNAAFSNATNYGVVARKGSNSSITNTYFDGNETEQNTGVGKIDDTEAFKTSNNLAYPFVIKENDFPALSWETSLATPATENACTSWYDDNASVFAIAGADDLSGLRSLIADGKTFENKTVYLIKDIDLSNISDWTPIGGNTPTPSEGTGSVAKLFKGTLDGQNHVISGMKIAAKEGSNQFVGLFNHLGGTVKNLGMANADIKLYSNSYFGGAGVVAYALTGGTVENVYVKNSAITRTSGNAARPFNAGAIAGHIYKNSSVVNCYAKDVAIKDESGSTADSVIGGIAGAVAQDNISGKFVTGETGVTFKNTYAADFKFNVRLYNGLAVNKAGKSANIIAENVFTDIAGDNNAVGKTVSKSKLKNAAIFTEGFKADIYGQNGYYPILSGETVTKTKTGIVIEHLNSTEAKIANTSDGEKSAYIVIAYYNNGNMTGAEVIGTKAITADNAESFTITKPSDCNLVKAFVFNSDSDISPLNYAIEY